MAAVAGVRARLREEYGEEEGEKLLPTGFIVQVRVMGGLLMGPAWVESVDCARHTPFNPQHMHTPPQCLRSRSGVVEEAALVARNFLRFRRQVSTDSPMHHSPLFEEHLLLHCCGSALLSLHNLFPFGIKHTLMCANRRRSGRCG